MLVLGPQIFVVGSFKGDQFMLMSVLIDIDLKINVPQSTNEVGIKGRQ